MFIPFNLVFKMFDIKPTNLRQTLS